MRTILDPTVYKTVTADCPACGGKGFTKKGTCGTCGGSGTHTVTFPDD
ncbi:hypothetical protein [Streptomyces sp.]